MAATALIPARGGSRRIPRKNVKEFLGVPAVARVIRTLEQSSIFDRTVVSTDDDEVASVAENAGAEIPGVRPAGLSGDTTPTIDVVRHAITQWLSDCGPATTLWVVYPTAVLLSVETLLAAEASFVQSEADFLIPVLRYPHPVERRLRLSEDGCLVPDEPASIASRSQDLPAAFHDSGQFYIGSIASWQRFSPLSTGRSIPFEMDPDSAVDIDEPEHWLRAERLVRLLED
jgi:N-acylneuraminate cytidylyltransferase